MGKLLDARNLAVTHIIDGPPNSLTPSKVRQVLTDTIDALLAYDKGAFTWTWSTNTAASDPGSGVVKGNNATQGSITSICLSETALEGAVGGMLTSAFGSSSAPLAMVTIANVADRTKYIVAAVTAHVDSGAYRTLTCTIVSNGGAIANGATVSVQVVRCEDGGSANSYACEDGGSANSYLLTMIGTFVPPTALVAEMRLRFRPGAANTGASVLNAFSLGERPLVDHGLAPLSGAELESGRDAEVIWRPDVGGSGSWVLPAWANALYVDPSPTNAMADNSSWLQLSRTVAGMTLSNSLVDTVNDIVVAAGSCASDGAAPAVMSLASAITKRTNAAWSAGTNAGGWLDGSAMPDGTAHVFAIRRPDTGAVDIALSASLTPELPANYTQRRRIGSVLRAAGALRPFRQVNDRFTFVEPVTDISSTTLRAAAPLTLSVPSGLPVRALLRVKPISESGYALRVASDTFDCYSTTTATYMSYEVAAQTNADQQIMIEAAGTAGSLPWSVATTGWIDEARSV